MAESSVYSISPNVCIYSISTNWLESPLFCVTLLLQQGSGGIYFVLKYVTLETYPPTDFLNIMALPSK